MSTRRIEPRTTGEGVAGTRARAAVALSVTLLLIGCPSTEPGQATLDVSGVVVGRIGQPLSGVGVTVDDATWTVTGADGRFAFEEVATPYDVTTFDAAEGWAHRTVGLTASNLELAPYPVVVEDELAGASTATVAGAFAAPIGAGQRARVCLEGLDRPILGCSTVFEGLSLYEIDAQWMGGPVDATLRAVVFDMDDDGNGSGIAAHGSAPVALDPGGYESADMTLVGLAGEATLEVALDVPVGYPLDGAWAMTARSGGRSSVRGLDANVAGDLITAYVPALVDATHTVYAIASHDDGASVGWVVGAEPDHAAALSLPEPSAPQGPLPGAAGVGTTTPFTIEAPEGQRHLFGFVPQGDGPSLYVATTEATARIPDLSAISEAFVLPPGAGYLWSVSSATGGGASLGLGGGVYGPYGRLANMSMGAGSGPAEDGGIAASAGGAFTLE